MLRIVEHWPWIASLALASTASAQRAAPESDSIPAYDERSTLVVRVMDEHGPVVRKTLEVSVSRSWRKEVDGDTTSFGSGGSRHSLFTDEAGVMRVPLDDPDQVKNPPRRRSAADFAPVVLEGVHLSVWTDDGFGQRTLWGPFPPGDVELDELVLRPTTVVVSGRVTDAHGRPVSGARVLARSMETSFPLRATTNEAGAFVLRDRAPSPVHLELLAITDEGLSEVLTTSGGSRDVALVVARPFGELTGRVLLDAGIPRQRIRIYSRDSGWSSHLSPDDGLDFECGLDARDSFALYRMLPQTYVLRVHADRMELASVPVGTLRAGAIHTVDPIDLRGRLRSIRLTLASRDAASRFVGTVAVLPRKGFGISEPMPFEGSSCVLLSTGEPLAIELCVEGNRTLRLADVREDWTVELEPGWPVRLVVHDELDVPDPSVSWAIALRPVGEHTFGEPIEFPPGSREVRTVVPETGEYAIGWIRRERAGSSVYESYYPEPDYPRIEIRDVAGEQAFEFYAPVAR